MSVLNQKPYIQTVIESLTNKQVEDLGEAVNGGGETIFRSFLNLSAPLTTSDKGVHHCVLEVKDAVFTGYLLYNDTYCVLAAYNGVKNQAMKILNIAINEDKYEVVDEELSISEFREIIRNAGFKKISVTNITEMTDDQLNLLKCGDVVVKITVQGDNVYRHTYVVSYKEDFVGICMTYCDAETVETVSYDYTDGHWVYNSTDVTTI